MSTITNGHVRLLATGASRAIEDGSRLRIVVEGDNGRLARLTQAKDGIRVLFEGRVSRLELLQAGSPIDLRPTLLEVGFHQAAWLFYVCAAAVCGATVVQMVRHRR